MNNNQKAFLFNLTRNRYLEADKMGKSKILDELCVTCKCNRKYAIRKLNREPKQSLLKPGPTPQYDSPELLEPLKRIWFTADQPCGKRLKAILPLWIKFYEREYGTLSDKIKKQLCCVSSATIDRILKPIRAKSITRGMSGTKPGTILKNRIDIKTHNWDVSKPGFVEADTVALCGNSLAGSFIWCLTLTDIMSGWTEIRVTWNKGAEGILKQIKNIEETLHFPLLGFDSDNGTEFMNHHLLRYLEERNEPVRFTRSRPYKKNDNAHVEQKNWTHVRQLFGYDRFDNSRAVDLMNDLLSNEWSHYQNHFLPTTKLLKKTRINSKYKKVYDQPKTPYHRLMRSTDISKIEKLKLAEQHILLNPFILKSKIEQKLKQIFALVQIPSGTKPRI